MNGISFLVYKKCPNALEFLIRIFERAWTEKSIPVSWQRAIIILLAKSTELNDPAEFRPVTLFNAEGRLFFTLMHRRLSDYTLKHGYIIT